MAIFIYVFSFQSFSLFAQSPYFQQYVKYKIEVKLDDVKHELSAFEEIKYVNKASTSLTYIYMHLWPNAYKNHGTALAKQLLENGNTSFYYSSPQERGYIDSLDFKVDGKSVKVEYDSEHIDICKLILNEPIRSLDTIVISTPFHVKLPDAKFSRLGHTRQAYYITQWYPKPAVYDELGWHPMPYLNQGEFYSEFGEFDVKITVPKNYLLAATGDRINAKEEEEFINSKLIETQNLIAKNELKSKPNKFPPSSTEFKTIRFMQSNVHDFAWFADKRFHVLKDEITLPVTHRKVDTWLYFTDYQASLWKDALEYIDDATLFYSYMLGDYPYNHVTAIDGVIAAGGGMEYPNITVIGESTNAFNLETTIMHEVGHNWFYGILGSNERDNPALDEGLNSFYEMRYISTKYPRKTLAEFIGRDSTFKLFGLNQLKHSESYKLAYLLAARKNLDQSLAITSPEYTNYNYGAMVYSKTAIVIDYLMNTVGDEKFDEGMQFYFQNWKFKHPKPKDLQKTLEYYTALDLDWFINGLIYSTKKLDYKICKHKKDENGSHQILVKNVGEIEGPVTLAAYKDKKVIGQVWYGGFKGKKWIGFPSSEVDKFKIDGFDVMPEINKQNNTLRLKGLFKKLEPIQFNLLGKIDNPDRTQINLFPILGYNYYNKFMLGCAIYNYGLLQKKFEYTLAPMYAFGSNTAAGFADFQLNLHPKKSFQSVTPGLKFKTFAYDFANQQNLFPESNETNPSLFAFNYFKIEPFIKFDFKKRDPRSPIQQSLNFRTVVNSFEEDHTYDNIFINVQNSPYKKVQTKYVNEIAYLFYHKRTINPFDFKIQFQQNEDFSKINLTAHYNFSLKGGNAAEIRWFVGTFITGNNTGPYRFRASGLTGYQDYMYDYNFLGRSEFDGLAFSQFAENDGAMKIWTPLGQSNTWLSSINIKSPKIKNIPIKLFADVVITDKDFLNTDQFLFCGGFDICILKDVFEIYIPLLYSKDIQNTLTLNGKDQFMDRIRFTFNIHKLNPRDLLNSSFN